MSFEKKNKHRRRAPRDGDRGLHSDNADSGPNGRGRSRQGGAKRNKGDPKNVLIYGIHPVREAIKNPKRNCISLKASRNGLSRLDLQSDDLRDLRVEEVLPRALDTMVGRDAVHQGVILEAEPLLTEPLDELVDGKLVLVLDQVTDPHNVGAIMRSCVAMGASAIITTSRNSASETGVLAKSASGALDLIDHYEVTNLSKSLETLHDNGFTTIGLDSEGEADIAASLAGEKIALVLGAEGKGLRQKTRETCHHLAKLDMPGPIKSLNVSNAAALSLYLAHSHLTKHRT